jgi:hypothetical protein
VGGADTFSWKSIVLGDGGERVSIECDISGIECAGKYTDSDSGHSALSAEGASVDETDGVSREGSGSSGATPSLRYCDVD